MDAQDQTQLAYLAESLMRAPSQYRRLIEIVREENASPSANLREALDELVSALDQHLDAGKDPYDGLCSAAEDLFKKSGPARYAGRALAGSLENYRMLQQKSAQNR